MNPKLVKLFSLLLIVTFTQLACYKRYNISTDELEKLQSGEIAETVVVMTDSGEVTVSGSTPIEIVTATETYDLTPFNFSLTDSQLVAPDYDLLVSRRDVTGGRVGEFNKTGTILVIVGSVLAAGGVFFAISALASPDQGLE